MRGKDNSKPCFNTILNGSALIFSPIYVENFVGLDERTFMYLEEFILYEHVIRRGYKTYFTPKLRIFHEHEVTTKVSFKNTRQKELWRLKHQMESLKILKAVIKEYEGIKERKKE